MGTSTDAKLLYGYHLGGEDEWLVENVGEYGELPTLEWYDPEHDSDIIAVAERRLLTEVAGFTETYVPGVHGYWDRRREAEDNIGVRFEYHCSDEYPMYVLSAHTIIARRGDIHALDLDSLAGATTTFYDDWNKKLAVALRALGLTPRQPRPMWLLCSYWG